jgi:hypothetical protein
VVRSIFFVHMVVWHGLPYIFSAHQSRQTSPKKRPAAIDPARPVVDSLGMGRGSTVRRFRVGELANHAGNKWEGWGGWWSEVGWGVVWWGGSVVGWGGLGWCGVVGWGEDSWYNYRVLVRRIQLVGRK